MNKLIRILQIFGTIISIFGCWMVFQNIMTALVIEFVGLSAIFTAIQIEEHIYER